MSRPAISHAIVCLLIAALLSACATVQPQAGDLRTTLAVLATTDLHGHVLGYDYHRSRENAWIGLDRLATVIEATRSRYPNTVLVDNGDTIQGSVLADWQATVQIPACDRTVAIYEAMERIGYDAATLGNHEFNFGLPWLYRVTGRPYDEDGSTCRGPAFPLVLSNLDPVGEAEPAWPPTLLLERTMRVEAGGTVQEIPIRIGVLGFVPPAILLWDRQHLEGRVRVTGAVEAARRHVRGLREQGADVVIALLHGGLDPGPHTATMENAGWHLAGVAGIDALVLGHQHEVFPDPANPESPFLAMPGVDSQRGLVRGVPAVMAGSWGRALGVIELPLVHRQGRWLVDRGRTRAEVRFPIDSQGEPVAPHPAVLTAVRAEHEAVIAHVERPIGESDFPLATWFADVGDVSAVQVVNLAQADYVRERIATLHPELADLPVLSAAAPFRSGRGGPDDYTEIPAGVLALRHAADLYVFPNTLVAVQVDGAGLKAWLERSAARFNRIDPDEERSQALVDASFAGYNFDIIHGVEYVIDITRPVGGRIVELRHDGREVAPDQRFIVATNSYRAAGGGGFPGLGPEAVVFDSQVENRQVLTDWLRSQRRLTRPRHGADRPWRFAPVAHTGEIVFTTRAGLSDQVASFGLERLFWLGDTAEGTGRYALDLRR